MVKLHTELDVKKFQKPRVIMLPRVVVCKKRLAEHKPRSLELDTHHATTQLTLDVFVTQYEVRTPRDTFSAPHSEQNVIYKNPKPYLLFLIQSGS